MPGMQDELYNQFMKGYQMPGDIPSMLQNVVESPPDEQGLKRALGYYMDQYQFPEMQTALQAGGVGSYDQDVRETLPAALQDFLGQSAFRRQQKGSAEDYDEKQRQTRIFLSLLQGGGAAPTPFTQ